MTHDEAFTALYGPSTNMRAVLEHRRAVAQEARDHAERLRRELTETFPPVDAIGSRLDNVLEAHQLSLDHLMNKLDRLIGSDVPG